MWSRRLSEEQIISVRFWEIVPRFDKPQSSIYNLPVAYKSKEKQREYQRQWVNKRRQDWLNDKSCSFCKSTDKLEIDHIDPKKKITHRIWSWTLIRRNIELEKCRVLCHVCHKKRSDDQKRKEIVHGTVSAYHYRKCRCKLCKIAAYQYEKGRIQRKGIAQVLKT